MQTHIIMLEEQGLITDVIAISDYDRAIEIVKILSSRFGSENVSRTLVTIDETPQFWGLSLEECHLTPREPDPAKAQP